MFVRHVAAGVAAVALMAASPAFAADPPPSAHALELAKRYFADMHMDQTMHGMMRNMMTAMTAQMAKDRPDMTAEQRQAIADAAAESSSAMVTKLADQMAPVFASTFTEKELEDLVGFYESPTGRSMVAKMPLVMAKLTPVMVQMMPQVQADMRQRVCAKTDCSKLAPPKAGAPNG